VWRLEKTRRVGVLALGAGLEVGEVAVVVLLHLEVEDPGVHGRRRRHKAPVEEAQDPRADPGELGLHARAVPLAAAGSEDQDDLQRWGERRRRDVVPTRKIERSVQNKEVLDACVGKTVSS
jgi:hypothetical protein